MNRVILYFIGIVAVSILGQSWITQPVDPSKALTCEDFKLKEQIKSLKVQVAGLQAAAREVRAESCFTCNEVIREHEEDENDRRAAEDNEDLAEAGEMAHPGFLYIRYMNMTRVHAVTQYRFPIENAVPTPEELNRVVALAHYYSIQDRQAFWIYDGKLEIVFSGETKPWGSDK